MNEVHPARRAGVLSQRYVAAGERDKWLDLFAEDAVIQDPVGPSPLDPSGKGQVGKARDGANPLDGMDQPWLLAWWDGKARFDIPMRQFGGGKHNAANGAFGTDFAPLHATRIDAFQVFGLITGAICYNSRYCGRLKSYPHHSSHKCADH